MGDPNRQSPPPDLAPRLTLRSISFMPGISVTVALPTASTISHWDAEKYPTIKVEEQKNGDVWLTTPDGRRRELKPWAIAYVMREPEAKK